MWGVRRQKERPTFSLALSVSLCLSRHPPFSSDRARVRSRRYREHGRNRRRRLVRPLKKFLPHFSSSPPRPAGLQKTRLFLRGLQDLERAHQRLVHAHHRPGVVELPAVVGRGEDRHELPAREELVAVLHDLVRPADEVQVVPRQELGDGVRAEGVRDAPVVLAPPLDVLVRVRPEQIAQQAGVGHVRGARDVLDLVQSLELGGEPAVHAQDLLVDQGRHGQTVEAVRKGLPQPDRVPPLALVVEAVDAVDGGALVVAAEKEEVLRVLDLF